MSDERLGVIRTFLNVYEAEMAKGVLEAAGLVSFVRSDDAGGLHPGMWTARGVQLIVRTEDIEEAERVLTTFTGPTAVDPGE